MTEALTSNLAVNVLKVNRALSASVRGVAGRPFPHAELTRAQIEVMRHVRMHPNLSINEIAEGLHLAPNTVSTLVGALDEAELITRTPDPQDRRINRVDLTPQARIIVERWRDARTDGIAAAITRLTDEDRQALTAAIPVLERLAQLVMQPEPAH